MIFLFITVTQIWSITLRIASPAPKNSDWDYALREIAGKWSEITNGRVKLRIQAGGITGDEDDMLRKMKNQQLDGSILSGIGLNKINSELMLLSLPMFIRNSGELDYLLDKMGDDFEKILENNDYQLIGWQMLGWVYVFSKKPVLVPDDLKALKFSVTQNDLFLQRVWQSLGFQIVPSTYNEVMIGLQTGRIDAFYAPSILAASNQWFAQAPYMTDMPLTPLLAAFIITEKAWNQVPELYREDLIKATRKIIYNVMLKTKELEDKALNTMEDYGLNLVELDDVQIKSWNSIFLKSRPELVGNGKAISNKFFVKAEEILNEYRSKNN